MDANRTVRVDEPAPGIRVITLDRPHRLNAMSGELISELHRVLDDTRADEECRVVVLTGAGRGFCAGLDLKEAAAWLSRWPATSGSRRRRRRSTRRSSASACPAVTSG